MPRQPSSTPVSPRPYGAAELKEFQPRAQMMSMLFSAVLVQSAAFLLSWLSVPEDAAPPQSPGPRDTVSYRDIFLPPLQIPPTPARAGLMPKFGTPVPVDEHIIDTSSSFPTSIELQGSSMGDGEGPGAIVIPDPVVVVEREPPVFVSREVEPTVAVRVDPVYPSIAVRAGLEGNVYVNVWVDTEGAVRKAVIVKSDASVFDEAAIDAVRRWVFTPALMQNRPVSVWVTIPLRFRLQVR